MSNFAARLDELMERAMHPNTFARKGVSTGEIAGFLVHYAPAIRDLVRAASEEHGGIRFDPECPLCIAVAKLEEA